jgi:RHS repeat-associated protein
MPEMNAHDMMNSGAFDSSGMRFDLLHFAKVLSTLGDVWTYTWNYRNEMTGFSEKNASGTVIASGTYTYDSLDRRIGVDETSGGTTTQTWIVFNGDSNTPDAQFNGSGTLLESYLAGPSYVPGVTGMVARTNASGVIDWYLTGKLGSVRDIVNTSGTVIDHISYGAFGSIRAETNPSSGSQFKFEGMQYDTVTRLYNDWHRAYSASDGIFISQDPNSFSSISANLYLFNFNSPINYIDITGFIPFIGYQEPVTPTPQVPLPSSPLPNFTPAQLMNLEYSKLKDLYDLYYKSVIQDRNWADFYREEYIDYTGTMKVTIHAGIIDLEKEVTLYTKAVQKGMELMSKMNKEALKQLNENNQRFINKMKSGIARIAVQASKALASYILYENFKKRAMSKQEQLD